MSVKIIDVRTGEEADIEVSESDIEEQTKKFIDKKDMTGALTYLDRLAHRLEKARMMASQNMSSAQKKLSDPAVQFNRSKFISQEEQAEEDLKEIERLDNTIGKMVYRIRTIEKARPELSEGESMHAPSPPPGAYAKMIKSHEAGVELWFCDNPNCPGKGITKPMKIPRKTDTCPFCKNKLKYIGKEEQ